MAEQCNKKITTKNDVGKYDYLLDARSHRYEHWTYNFGIARLVLNARFGKKTVIRTTKVLSDLFKQAGIAATPRNEHSNLFGSRFLSLIYREIISTIEIAIAVHSAKQVLVLHVHPLSLILATPIIALSSSHVTICLHNDFIASVRSKTIEGLVEKTLWYSASFINQNVDFVAQNKYFLQFSRRFFCRNTKIHQIDHPIVPRLLYQSLATGIELDTNQEIHAGFFGSLNDSRGISSFLDYVKSQPDKLFIVAGRGAVNIPYHVNLRSFESPTTELYCALAIRVKSIFIDLRGEVYKIGESGVFWDVVGLNVKMLVGEVPVMYKRRIKNQSKTSVNKVQDIAVDNKFA
jgi:hypothetical protein